MAGAHCATFPFLAHPIHCTAKLTKPLISAYIAVPSKLARRKNYLRPKILKTLTEPGLPLLREQPLANPEIPIESPVDPSQNDPNLQLSSNAVAGEGNEVEKLSVSETTTPEYKGIVGKFSAKSVIKFGVYLIGAYLFQAFFTVWLLGNDNPDEENRKVSISGLSKSKGNVLNANVGSQYGVYLDELQLDEKIEEIRAMAREARKKEKREAKGSIGDEDDVFDESSMPKNRIGIEKEVGERLVKLQKRLNSRREKLRGPYVNNLRKHEKDGDEMKKNNENSKEGDGTLMYKKKLKFKAEAKRSPEGFGGLEEHGDSTSTSVKSSSGGVDAMVENAGFGKDGVELLDADNDTKGRERDLGQNVSQALDEDPKLLSIDGNHSEKGTGRVEKDIGAENTETQNGTVRRTRRGRPTSEGVKSRKSRELKKKNSDLKKEIQEPTIKSGDNAVVSVNGSSRHKEAKRKPVANKVSGNRSKIEADPWWLDLPYVLVILMRRGSGSEGEGGLFTLKLNSQPQNHSDSSYTVAFEDRTDANNFCLLLESFFEDLGDFTADIAPLPNKELREAVNSDNMKVVFVKRGQLQLYAGQPFDEVELALRSLVEHD